MRLGETILWMPDYKSAAGGWAFQNSNIEVTFSSLYDSNLKKIKPFFPAIYAPVY